MPDPSRDGDDTMKHNDPTGPSEAFMDFIRRATPYRKHWWQFWKAKGPTVTIEPGKGKTRRVIIESRPK